MKLFTFQDLTFIASIFFAGGSLIGMGTMGLWLSIREDLKERNI